MMAPCALAEMMVNTIPGVGAGRFTRRAEAKPAKLKTLPESLAPRVMTVENVEGHWPAFAPEVRFRAEYLNCLSSPLDPMTNFSLADPVVPSGTKVRRTRKSAAVDIEEWPGMVSAAVSPESGRALPSWPELNPVGIVTPPTYRLQAETRRTRLDRPGSEP